MRKVVERAGKVLALAVVPLLVHGRGLADVALSAIAVLFLLRSVLNRDWHWLRQRPAQVALLWWGWLFVCSIAAGHGPQALAVVRFTMFTTALNTWLLRADWLRAWMARLIRWAGLYLAAQCLIQFTFGRNLFGWPRGADGELTGPYDKPRAGPILSRLLYPTLLPLASTPLRALLWLGGGLVVMVLVGQRMPFLLSLLGLLTTALLLPRLRLPLLSVAVAIGLLLAALPAVSPEAAHRLESKFQAQMATLASNHYGLIAARAVAIVRAHPLLGAGFDGFRRLCDDPAYFHGWYGGDGGGAGICVQHPHNVYLQAAVEAGLPGLALFTAMGAVWLWTIGQGLLAAPDRLRVGLFVAALVQLWPIAASTDWVAMPLAGWFHLQLGLALALAPPYMREPRQSLARP